MVPWDTKVIIATSTFRYSMPGLPSLLTAGTTAAEVTSLLLPREGVLVDDTGL